MTAKEFEDSLLSSIIIDGHSVSEDTVEKAKHGDPKAINTIAESYYKQLDYDKAILWYRRSAAKNNAKVQNRMGDIYYHGQGVAQNRPLALEWYTKAANQGDKAGMKRISEMREAGHGAPADRGAAMYHYYQAFLLGDISTLVHLGNMHKSNEPYEALMWYTRAAERGIQEGKKQVKELNKKNVWLTLNSKALIKAEQRIEKLEELLNAKKDHHADSSSQARSPFNTSDSQQEEVALLKEKIRSLEMQLELKTIQLQKERTCNTRHEEADNIGLGKRVKMLKILVANLMNEET